MDNNKKLEILHDHHKDSFENIREREKQRDRLFLILISLLGLLVFQLQYNLAGISEVSILGVKVLLDKLPGAVILSATWTYVLVLLVRYYQVTVVIENQYDYLHRLEERLSALLGDEKLYRRESAAYLVKKAQGFRTWIWRYYTVAIPIMVIAATARAAYLEYCSGTIPIYHKIYDGVTLIAALWLIGLYFLRYGFPKLQVSFPALEDSPTATTIPTASQAAVVQGTETIRRESSDGVV
jgi:hypothetical protein